MERARAGSPAIVLVPEIALTPQTVRRFATRFPTGSQSSTASYLLVSATTPGAAPRRRDSRRCRRALGAVRPPARHWAGDPRRRARRRYKQSPPIPPPYYHARDVAIRYMQITRGTVILGSATPDVGTYFRAQDDGPYRLLKLPDRVIAHRDRLAEQIRRLNAPIARYHPIDGLDAMSAELPSACRSWICARSCALATAAFSAVCCERRSTKCWRARNRRCCSSTGVARRRSS